MKGEDYIELMRAGGSEFAEHFAGYLKLARAMNMTPENIGSGEVMSKAADEIERMRAELLIVSERERKGHYDNAPTDPHHGGKIWDEQ
jgi:hypothetical protein